MLESLSIKRISASSVKDLRYFFYLSRNDAWVPTPEGLFKFSIEKLGKGEEARPVTAQEAQTLKLGLSRNAIEADTFASLVHHLARPNSLPRVRFDAGRYEFLDLVLDTESYGWIHLHATAVSFNHSFVEQHATDESTSLKATYRREKKFANKAAIKNAIWLAATSGDSDQLAILLAEYPRCAINSTYQGKGIMHAMLDANGIAMIPFKREKPDYNATLQLLIQHGLNKKTVCNLYQHHQSNTSGFRLFSPSHSSHTTMLLDVIRENMPEVANTPTTARRAHRHR